MTAEPVSAWRRLAVGPAVVGAAAAYELNITVATVALPHMQGTFAATHDQISWVVTSFIVGMTCMLACAGWLADRFGRKRVFVICTASFTIVSFMCGVSTTVEEEVLWRFLQGALGAPLMPLSQAIILDMYPKEKHGFANAIWGIAVMVGPAMGPTVGGWITEYYTWPWVFFIAVPMGTLATLAVAAVLREAPYRADRRMDWTGLITLTLAVSTLQLVLNRGERQDWFESTEIILTAAASVLCLYIFVVHSMTARHPFVEPNLLRDRNMALGTALAFLWGFILHGNLVLVSLLMQELRGYPVLTLGIVMSPRGFGVMIGMFMSSQIVKHVDPRLVLMTGLAMIAGSSLAMSGWSADVDPWDVAWTNLLHGVGTGMGFIPLSVMTFATIDTRYRTEGLTLFNLVLFSGISAGIAVAINVLTRSMNVNHATLSEHISRLNEIMRQPGQWDAASAIGLATIEAEVTRQATMIGYLNNFHLITILSVIAIPCALLFRRAAVQAARTTSRA
jgi:MFS transporter, DHA2 family, multidrug resistance protein